MLYDNVLLWRFLKEELSYPVDGSSERAIPEAIEDPKEKLKREERIKEAETVSLSRLCNHALDFAGYDSANDKVQELIRKWIKASILSGQTPPEETVLSCFHGPSGEKLFAYLEFLSRHGDIKLAEALREAEALGQEPVERQELPQIDEKDLNAFARFLQQQGIDAGYKAISAASLSPIQSEVNREKVESLKENPKALEKPLIVTNDNKILDGHHRWVAQRELHPEWISTVFYINAPIDQAVQLGHAFGKSYTKNIHESLNEADDDGSALVKQQADALGLTAKGFGYWADHTGEAVAQTVTVNGRKQLVRLEPHEKPDQEKQGQEEEPPSEEEPQQEPEAPPAEMEPEPAKSEPETPPDEEEPPVEPPKGPERSFSEWVEKRAFAYLERRLPGPMGDLAKEVVISLSIGLPVEGIFFNLESAMRHTNLDADLKYDIFNAAQDAVTDAENLEPTHGDRPAGLEYPEMPSKLPRWVKGGIKQVMSRVKEDHASSFSYLTPKEKKVLGGIIGKYLLDRDIPALEDALRDNMARGETWISNYTDAIQHYGDKVIDLAPADESYKATSPDIVLNRNLPNTTEINDYYRNPDHFTKDYSYAGKIFNKLFEQTSQFMDMMKDAGNNEIHAVEEAMLRVFLPGCQKMFDAPPDVNWEINSKECDEMHPYIKETPYGLHSMLHRRIYLSRQATNDLAQLLAYHNPESIKQYIKGENIENGEQIRRGLRAFKAVIHEIQHSKDRYLYGGDPSLHTTDVFYNFSRDILEGLTEYRAQEILNQLLGFKPEHVEPKMRVATDMKDKQRYHWSKNIQQLTDRIGTYGRQVRAIKDIQKADPEAAAKLWKMKSTKERITYADTITYSMLMSGLETMAEAHRYFVSQDPEIYDTPKQNVAFEQLNEKLRRVSGFTLWQQGKAADIVHALNAFQENPDIAKQQIDNILYFDNRDAWHFGFNPVVRHPLMTPHKDAFFEKAQNSAIATFVSNTNREYSEDQLNGLEKALYRRRHGDTMGALNALEDVGLYDSKSLNAFNHIARRFDPTQKQMELLDYMEKDFVPKVKVGEMDVDAQAIANDYELADRYYQEQRDQHMNRVLGDAPSMQASTMNDFRDDGKGLQETDLHGNGLQSFGWSNKPDRITARITAPDGSWTVPLDSKAVSMVPGLRGEHMGKIDQKRVAELVQSMKENGYKPGHAIAIDVINGNPFIYEGNHRVRACAILGIPVPAEVRYLGNCERDAKTWKPPFVENNLRQQGIALGRRFSGERPADHEQLVKSFEKQLGLPLKKGQTVNRFKAQPDSEWVRSGRAQPGEDVYFLHDPDNGSEWDTIKTAKELRKLGGTHQKEQMTWKGDLEPPKPGMVNYTDRSWDQNKPRPQVYRGVTSEEAASIAKSGEVKSTKRYSDPSEGTSFAQDYETADSYVNFGRDDPRKTGKPTYVLELDSGPDMFVDPRDYYVKAHLGVPINRVTRAWRYDPSGAVVPVVLKDGQWEPVNGQ